MKNKGVDHQDKLVSLRRIEGQIRGVHRMVEDRRYCMDILHAIAAISGALKTVEAAILRDHLHGCVMHAAEGRSRKEKEAKLNEVYKLFKDMRK